MKEMDKNEKEENEESDEDNILRKQTVKLSIEPSEKEMATNERENSPNSPDSPYDILRSPKFNDQVSIDLEDKVEKK